MDPAPPTGGGLRDQILGTLILMVGVFIIAGTIGVLAGIHLAEFTQAKKASGRPAHRSHCLGHSVGLPLHRPRLRGLRRPRGRAALGLLPASALIILSIMVIPYIAKTTENSLRQVPTGYREGAAALGMSAGYGLRKVVLKSALPGIATGLLLALAIACGETAPLIYTAGFSNTSAALSTHTQFPYLTYVVFTYYNDPSCRSTTSPTTRADPRRHCAPPAGGQPVVVVRTQRNSESAPQGGRGFFTRFRTVTVAAPPEAAAPRDGRRPFPELTFRRTDRRRARPHRAPGVTACRTPDLLRWPAVGSTT